MGRFLSASVAVTLGALLAVGPVGGVPPAGGAPERAGQDPTSSDEGPLFSGERQQPFVCTTARAEFEGRRLLGQPEADNFDAEDPTGIPVAAEDDEGDYPQDDRGYPTDEAEIVGWSRNCETATRVHHVYRSTDGGFHWLDDPTDLPADVAETTTLDGDTVPYVVRWEVGTVNRFIYSVAMLVPPDSVDGDGPDVEPDTSLWNERAVLRFQGGVGIGHHQGTVSSGAMLEDELVGQGYAVLWSTGTRTSTHYNLQVGGETAVMLKDHFVETYGDPLYTVAMGGSGGGIQQYIYGQNHPDLIDAAIPQYSYPDMVSQTIHIGDCELLEHYFEVTDRDNDRWRDPALRRAVIGLNVTAPANLSESEREQWEMLYLAYDILGYQTMERGEDDTPTLSECRPGWIGATPTALNPTFHTIDDVDQLAQDTDDVEWSHMADLAGIYGIDPETGYARRAWDNVGLQYGLEAVADDTITPEEFLDLNAQIGGWTTSGEMVTEGYPYEGDLDLDNFDIWSSRNMTLSPDGGETPAPRTEGDPLAVAGVYREGMRFDGDLNEIPIIDWRHHLEHELDMHNVHQSFAARQRLLDHDGEAGNQVIWFTEAQPQQEHDQTWEAFEVIDEWMANIRANPEADVAENRPDAAVDSCFATDGSLLASGEDVWAGVLDDGPEGACTEEFDFFSTSRRVAGGPFDGGLFMCQLRPVADAVEDGDYGAWQPDAAQQARLEEIFPDGVCDWSRADAGRPDGDDDTPPGRDPSDPGDPGDPDDPDDPGDPDDPDGPGDPGDPDGPGDPGDPGDPSDGGDRPDSLITPPAPAVTGRPDLTG